MHGIMTVLLSGGSALAYCIMLSLWRLGRYLGSTIMSYAGRIVRKDARPMGIEIHIWPTGLFSLYYMLILVLFYVGRCVYIQVTSGS